MTTEAIDTATAPAPIKATALLAPMEASLNELETRLAFLCEFFGPVDAHMPPAALHLFLSDCRAAAGEARERWSEAWVQAGGKDHAAEAGA